jgi:hypothetical protein
MGTFLVAFISIMLSALAQTALKRGMSGASVKLALSAPFGAPTVLALLMNKFAVLGFSLYGLGALVWLGGSFAMGCQQGQPIGGCGLRAGRRPRLDARGRRHRPAHARHQPNMRKHRQGGVELTSMKTERTAGRSRCAYSVSWPRFPR